MEGEERVSLGPQRMAGCQQQLPSLTECAEFRPWLASQTIFFFFFNAAAYGPCCSGDIIYFGGTRVGVKVLYCSWSLPLSCQYQPSGQTGDLVSGDPCKVWGGQAGGVWLQGGVLQQVPQGTVGVWGRLVQGLTRPVN